MADRSTTHLVLIPSYNPGPKVYETVLAALEQRTPVWVIVDGSTDDGGVSHFNYWRDNALLVWMHARLLCGFLLRLPLLAARRASRRQPRRAT